MDAHKCLFPLKKTDLPPYFGTEQQNEFNSGSIQLTHNLYISIRLLIVYHTKDKLIYDETIKKTNREHSH